MKKLLAFVGITLLVGVIALAGVAKYGERGLRVVDLSSGEISFDWLVEPKMNRINSLGQALGQGNFFSVQEKDWGSWDLIDANGNMLLNDFYQVTGITNSGDASTKVLVIEKGMQLEPVFVMPKAGLVTMSGDILLETQYNQIIRTWLPGVWATIAYDMRSLDLTKQDVEPGISMHNFIDINGNKIFKEDLTEILYIISKDRFIHKSGDEYGIVDHNLNVVVKHDYPNMVWVSMDRIALAKDVHPVTKKSDETEIDFFRRRAESSIWGLFDYNGNAILPMEYDRISGESEGLIAVEKNGKLGFIDRNGILIIDYLAKGKLPDKYSFFQDGMFAYRSHKLPLLSKITLFNIPAMYTTTVIDRQGKELFAINGIQASIARNGMFFLRKSKRDYGLVTRSGKFYPLPKDLVRADDAIEFLGEVIKIGKDTGEVLGQEGDHPFRVKAYGLLKFTIKEK